MRNIIMALVATVVFIGCSSDSTDERIVEPKLVVGKSLADLSLNNQFEKSQALNDTTTKVIFAFSKDMAHICNDFFVTQSATYLGENNTQFVADVSAAPSIIRNMFIIPGLKDFKHTVLVLNDENVAASYRAGSEVDKIVVVYVENKTITKILTVSTQDELKKIIQTK